MVNKYDDDDFQQFTGMTAPTRRGVSEIPRPHAAHLPYLPEPRQ